MLWSHVGVTVLLAETSGTVRARCSRRGGIMNQGTVGLGSSGVFSDVPTVHHRRMMGGNPTPGSNECPFWPRVSWP